MKPKLFFSLIVILILIIPFTLGTSVASANANCDPAFVTQVGDEITVRSNGVNDTANLQCAFDEAPAGGTVRLLHGTFYTKQLVVYDFHGRFVGAGDSRTTIVNLPEMYVTPVGFDQNPPSDENPWPTLIAFLGGNFSISDLAIHITGNDVTTGWQYTPDSPISLRLFNAILIQGIGEADVEISSISISGEYVVHPDYPRNLIYGIVVVGRFGVFSGSYSGSFQALDSSFSTMLNPIAMVSLANASVVISHNRFIDDFYGVWVEMTTDSSFEFSHNKTQTHAGLILAYSEDFADSGNRFLIKNNILDDEYGIVFDMNFGEGNECLLLGNNVQRASELGIYLGAGINGCTVVGGSNKTNVWDDGYDNILVGVNNMGTGVGPTIREMLELMR